MADKNPTSTCIGCTQTDDHPRHLIDIGGVNVYWHMDCHAIATGCPICTGIVANAHGAKGGKLRTHLTTPKG